VEIDRWVRTEASIPELRAMLEAVTNELMRREYVCAQCGRTIPTALPLRHPAHDRRACSRYTSMVTY